MPSLSRHLRQHRLADVSRRSRTKEEAGTLLVQFTGRDVRPVLGRKAKLAEPLQGGFLDGGFSHHGFASAPGKAAP